MTPQQRQARRAAAPARSVPPAETVQPALPVRSLRSWLFVPGDSERKQEKALASAADAVILDLEDSVAAAQLPAARTRVARLLRARSPGEGPQIFVRVNAPVSGLLREDVEAVFAGGVPDGIVLPKVAAAREVADVARRLAVLERRGGARPGRTRLLIIATETPLGVLSLPQYPAILGAVPALRERIAGLTWGAEDLSAALGARSQRDATGALTFTFQLARAHCLLAAGALGVQAIDGICTEFRDPVRLQHELEAARRDGFTGKLAIHPDQVAAINAAFAPTEAEREHAERVVAAFATAPSAGVVSLDGRMIDRPHLLQAQRILAVVQRARDGT